MRIHKIYLATHTVEEMAPHLEGLPVSVHLLEDLAKILQAEQTEKWSIAVPREKATFMSKQIEWDDFAIADYLSIEVGGLEKPGALVTIVKSRKAVTTQ
jgi:hypothetical protein